MRTFDFTPYYRSTVGFDRLLRPVSTRAFAPTGRLQHREEKRRQYRITMTSPALLRTKSNGPARGTLLVTGQKGEQPELLHQGIPLSFKQSFSLADHVKVVGQTWEHGLLTIDLVREVPEQLKRGASKSAQLPRRRRRSRIISEADRHSAHKAA